MDGGESDMVALRGTEDEAREEFCCRLVAILPALRGFARVLCRENDRADDLVQDAVVRAMAAIEQFQPGSNFKAWTFTILRNLYVSGFREHRICLEPLDQIDQVLFQAPTQENALAMRKLDEAVQKLPPLRREALVLVVAHGLSYDQVAAICGCAVGTVKSRVARAREELHAALSGEFVAEDRKADPTAQAARLERGAKGRKSLPARRTRAKNAPLTAPADPTGWASGQCS
jgi:RNA polymerase sigma-70 factor, ECF subfamily